MPNQRTHSPPGRIRLRPETAAYLRQLLQLERDRVVLQRRITKRLMPEGSPTKSFNRQVHYIDQMIEEIERTQQEMGWKLEDG